MTLSSDPAEQSRLVDYVRRALAAIDAGEAIDPTQFCSEHPHLAKPLADALGLAAHLPSLQGEALREDPLAGLVIGNRYRLLDCLGRGAMGVVYRAEDTELRRAVAVKLLDARLLRNEPNEQRFTREAEALASLQHENVVAVHDRGRTPEGLHFLVMELLDGATLATCLEAIGTSADPAAALRGIGIRVVEPHWSRIVAAWSRDLARGLAATHERSLVHRDVKPSNIFVVRDGRPLLIDFGLAARHDDHRLTATRSTLGTPWYMAPEQLRAGTGPAAPTIDVYGLGASMYHLLARQPPYAGDAVEVLAALATEDPRPLHELRPDVPRDLRAIVETCMQRDPGGRYATATALAEDLDRFLGHQPVHARPIGAIARRLRRWRRAPAKVLAIAAFTVALLIAGVATPIWLQQRHDRTLAEKNELYATLPSLLAIEGWPDERVLAELQVENRTAIDLLDRLLALDPNDLPVRLWRAGLRLDVGDRDGAAADLRAIADDGDSAFARGLADRYLRLDPSKVGAFAVDTTGLPAPTTAQDCYIAGFHELRARHVDGFAQCADELLSRAAESYLPARDLRLIAWAQLGERDATFPKKLYDETIALQALYGRPTARICAMRGVALLQQQRYEEAVADLQKSLELRPDRHGPHQNLGLAFLRLGKLEDAERHLAVALQLRPFASNTRLLQAQLARDRGQFAKAYEIAESLARSGSRVEAWVQPDLVGSIALEEATTFFDTDRDRSRRAAERSVAAYDEALRIRKSSLGSLRRAVAAALQQDDRAAAIVPFAETLLKTPDNPHQLATLAYLLPTQGLDARATAYVGAVIRSVAASRARGNSALRERLEREITEALAPYVR